MSQIKMWEFHDFHGGCTGKLQTNPDVAMRCIEVTLRCWEVTCVQRKKLSNPWDGQCQKLCQKPLKPCHNSLCWTARCDMLNPILWELFEHAWLFFNATLQQISSPKPDSCQVLWFAPIQVADWLRDGNNCEVDNSQFYEWTRCDGSAPRSRRRKSTRFQRRQSTRSRRLFIDIDNMITSTTRTKSTAVTKSTTQKH